jgi:hypothetical protein
LARHLVRERVVHDLAESEKHCNGCGKDLRLIAEETSERYEFIPAVMKVIEDVRLKYCGYQKLRRAMLSALSAADVTLLNGLLWAKDPRVDQAGPGRMAAANPCVLSAFG